MALDVLDTHSAVPKAVGSALEHEERCFRHRFQSLEVVHDAGEEEMRKPKLVDAGVVVSKLSQQLLRLQVNAAVGER